MKQNGTTAYGEEKTEFMEEIEMTREQAEGLMEHLRQIFSMVRLLKPEEVGSHLRTSKEGETCECYSVWNRKQPCLNCISQKVLEDHKQRTKLEYTNTKVFQVISRYVEIDGEPYVMEMISRLDDETLIDPEGRENLLGKLLSSYGDELYRDALTGVYNRRYFEDQIREIKLNAGVAMIDLDDFKMYNDTYGHNAGDMVLETIVKVVNRCIRKADRLIRYGGDEFLLILPEIDEENFSEKLQQIQTQIHEARVPGYTRMRLSVSIGGVIAVDETVEEAAYRSDKLMYQAKRQKNMVVTERDIIRGKQEEAMLVDAGKERQRILIVDDSDMNRIILSEILQEDYDILEAGSGEECLKLLEQYGTGISLILLDIVMPGMDGFAVLSFMNRNHWIEEVPVIMISSEDSTDIVRKAYEQGVSDYISRPFDSKIVYQRVFNTIKLYAKQRRLATLVTEQVYEKEKNNQMMISILSQIVEFRNGESGLHVHHINLLTGMLLERLVQKTDRYHLSWSDQLMITTASALHDIGKIGIPEEILNKPGRLTKEEFEEMKKHTLIGASMLESLVLYQNEKLLQVAYQICRWHHERYDGKGYPDGLKGEEIPISAQVVSLADVYDALTSERVYKPAYSHEKAIEMINHGECGSFNPLILECLMDIQDTIKEEMSKTSEEEQTAKQMEKLKKSLNSGGGQN